MAQGQRTIKEISVVDVEKRRHPGKHYVYIITITWTDGDISVIYRRYSKFFDFQVKLLDMFPKDAGKNDPTDRIIPFLPGKIIFGRSHIKEVALKRLEPINTYCKQLIQLPPLISESQHVLAFFTPNTNDLVPPDNRSEKKSPLTARSITEPILLEQFQVLSDYTKEGANEINLTAGETVDVVEKTETGWWFVSGDYGQGWIPSSYLELPEGQQDDRILDTPGNTARPYLSTRAYQPQENDELALELGTMVDVLERNLDGWWLVRCKGKEGRVPGSYLTCTDTLRAKRIIDAMGRPSSVDVVPSLSSISNLNIKSRPSQEVGGSTSVDVGGSIESSRGRRVFPPSVSSSHNPSPITLNPVSPTPARRFDHKPPPLPGAMRPKIADLLKSTGRHGNSAPSGDESPLVYRKPPPPRRSTIKKMKSPRPVSPPEEPIYMTVSDFQNQAGDGISFTEGKEVQVLDKHDTGWWYVRIEGQDGWVPAAYIQKTVPQKAKSTASNAPVNATNATKPAAINNFTSKLQEKLFGKKNETKQTSAQSSSKKGYSEPKSRSKPLPMPPKNTWSDDDWDRDEDSDHGDYMEIENQPIYANADDDENVAPVVPTKNYSTEEGNRDAALNARDRAPITTPRYNKTSNQTKQIEGNPKPNVIPKKPLLPNNKVVVPPNKPVVPKTKPQNKPQLPIQPPAAAKQTNITNGNQGLVAELSSRLPGNLGNKPGNIGNKPGNLGNKPGNLGNKPGNLGKKPWETPAAGARPKLPAKGGVAKQPEKVVPAQDSGATNVRAMKNMFEGR